MTKKARIYNGGKTVSSVSGAGKVSQLHVKNEVRTCPLIIWGFPDSSVGKESTYNAGDLGWDSIPGSGRSTGEGIGYPLQYSWASLVA